MKSKLLIDGNIQIEMTQAEAIQLRDEAQDIGLDDESAIGSRFIDELDSCIEEDEDEEDEDDEELDDDDDDDLESTGDLSDED